VLVRRESSVARAERDFKNTLITAPFDGVLSNLNVREGRRVNVNERLANLTDLSRLDVRFNLSDSQYGGLLSMQEKLEGRKVTVYWRAGNETRVFDAVIERTGAKIGSTTRGIDVYARIISNEAFRLVRGGAFVEVRLPDRLYSNVTKIPQEALYENQYIFIIKEGRLEKRNVILEGKSGEEVFISGNLQNGELILISQFPAVGVGVRVEVVK
ncbi:MAG: efflux RND transporter periplasmic adaptor subunit, partial [Parvibaculales bacterium]